MRRERQPVAPAGSGARRALPQRFRPWPARSLAGVRLSLSRSPDCPPRRCPSACERELGISGALAQVLVRRGLAEPAQRARVPGRRRGASAVGLRGHRARPSSRSCCTSRAAAGSRCTATTTSTGSARPRSSCARCASLGADVDSFLPDRAGDGYGLSRATVERLAARGTRLLMTADCAITAVEEVAARARSGMEVVVTDHHAAARRRAPARRADRASGALRLSLPGPVRRRPSPTSSPRRS